MVTEKKWCFPQKVTMVLALSRNNWLKLPKRGKNQNLNGFRDFLLKTSFDGLSVSSAAPIVVTL